MPSQDKSRGSAQIAAVAELGEMFQRMPEAVTDASFSIAPDGYLVFNGAIKLAQLPRAIELLTTLLPLPSADGAPT